MKTKEMKTLIKIILVVPFVILNLFIINDMLSITYGIILFNNPKFMYYGQPAFSLGDILWLISIFLIFISFNLEMIEEFGKELVE